MKTIEFTEDQISNLSEIGKWLFEDTADPRSSSYKRYLVRPKINWYRIVLCILGPILIAVAILLVLVHNRVSLIVSLGISGGLLCGYMFVRLKDICICMIKIYQCYAPDTIRNKCRYEPSCSEYMYLSIKKYGVVKGLRKGVDRLKRCNISGGGYDYP